MRNLVAETVSDRSDTVGLPSAGMIRGIDVYQGQGRIDWEAVRNGGIEFAFIKATEGATWTDGRFAENWADALYANVKRGAYHFLKATSGAKEQAEHFLRIYPGGGELPPALDFEIDPEDRIPSSEVALEWLEIVANETGVQPIIYVSPSIADDHLGPAFCVYDLWVAHWDVETPCVPLFWGTWRVWQTGKGHVTGIRGDVDLDVMREW